MIRPYLGDIINDHKTQGEWKVYLGNAVIDYKTQMNGNLIINDDWFYIF